MISTAEDREGERRGRPSAGARSRRAHAVQPRLAWPSWRMRGQSTRGPMPPSSAGSSVIDDEDGDERDQHAADSRRERSPGTGRTTSATSPIATVRPDSTTARPAVGHRDDHGVVVVAPARALLAPAGDDQQRVVDRDAEADEGDEELDDERDVGDVGERRGSRGASRGSRRRRSAAGRTRASEANTNASTAERPEGPEERLQEDPGPLPDSSLFGELPQAREAGSACRAAARPASTCVGVRGDLGQRRSCVSTGVIQVGVGACGRRAVIRCGSRVLA